MSWVNVALLRMDQHRDRPVLVEFFDFCRVSSLRTLPYVQEWHSRYASHGLRVVSVHCPGYEASRSVQEATAAVARLGLEHPVLLDHEFRLWTSYGNEGWPARYLWRWDAEQRGHVLDEFHLGEGGYVETELAIQSVVDVSFDVVAPVRPEDAPDASIVIPTPEQPGAYSGPYEAGGVWAVLSGRGSVVANGVVVEVSHPGAYELASHPVSTAGVLSLEVGSGVVCEAVQFTPGLAP